MAKNCSYCGAKGISISESMWGSAKLDSRRIVKVNGEKLFFCSDGCAREHTNQRQQNEVNDDQRKEQEARAGEIKQKQDDLDQARSFNVLQAGVHFSDWYSCCDQCDEKLLSPNRTDECDDCGTDRILELRHYADGYKRVMCCCCVCNTELVLRGLDCSCGGRASSAKTVIFDKNGVQLPSKVIFKSPRNIQAEDYAVDLNSEPVGNSKKSKWIALLLCLLLGIFGAHRFYAGKALTAILFMCTLGFMGYGILFDALIILIGRFKDSTGARLK